MRFEFNGPSFTALTIEEMEERYLRPAARYWISAEELKKMYPGGADSDESWQASEALLKR